MKKNQNGEEMTTRGDKFQHGDDLVVKITSVVPDQVRNASQYYIPNADSISLNYTYDNTVYLLYWYLDKFEAKIKRGFHHDNVTFEESLLEKIHARMLRELSKDRRSWNIDKLKIELSWMMDQYHEEYFEEEENE